jgi:mRNA interferase RelE/StbE
VSWAVEVQQPAEKELVALPSQVRKRIARALRALKDNPFPHGVKKLKARDGYRILFRVDRDARIVWVGAIGHRKDVYANYRSAAASFSRP